MNMMNCKAVWQSDKTIPWCIAFAGMVLLGVLLHLNIIPATDTAGRYIPMARAFAEGNWEYAFHPHSGVFFAALSGSLNFLLPIDAFRACQLAALLLWGMAAVPLYHIALRIWHKRETAVICSVLYLLCSHLQRYVYDGLRDNGRSLGFFLAVLGILMLQENEIYWKPVMAAALGCAVLITIRIDCVLFGILGILVFTVMDVIKHKWRCYRSSAAALLCLVLVAPQLYLNYCYSGYPVPNARYAGLCKKLGLPPLGRGK